jgi:opacity protein-like surface antigen
MALWISLFGACAALAQNSDLGLLGGISGPRGQTTVTGGTATAAGSVTPSFQIDYACQVLQRAADLYIELPLVIPVRVSGQAVAGPAGTASVGSSGPDLFFTPGLRLKFSPESRVSLYGAAGFGIASFGATSAIVLPATVVVGNRQNSPALGFGGGVDLRLTRLLSLRGEVRDFVTRAGLGGITGRNHAVLQLGIAFRF